MTATALRSSSSFSAPAHIAATTHSQSKSSHRANTFTKTSPVRRSRLNRNRFKAISSDMPAIDYLMIRHGQLECGPGARPIVPRCMTALPENMTEFLESLLPNGY